MARKQYLFKSTSIQNGALDDEVPGDPVRVSVTPCILCIGYEIEEEYLGDLVEILEQQKYELVGEQTEAMPSLLPLVMAGDSGAMYNITIDDSDPDNPVLSIDPA